MTTIHMETEKVRTVARKLDADGAQMLSSLNQTRSSASRLRFAWQGGDADEFNNELNRLIKNIENQVVALQTLSVRVSREVDEWQAVDHIDLDSRKGMFGSSFVTNNVPVAGTTAAVLLSTGKRFDWWGWGKDVIDGVDDVADDLADLRIADYGNMGRSLNKLLDTPHGGWVGRFEDTGRLIKSNKFLNSKGFKYGMEGLALAGDVADGFMEGEEWDKAIITGGMDFLATKGLRFALTKGIGYIVPGAGTALLVYDGALLTGRLVAGAMDVVGLDSQAAWLQNTLDAVDIGKYVEDLTEPLNDAIYDFASNFWKNLHR